MGLFDLFSSKEAREESAVRKLQPKVVQKYGPPENRQKAIEQLGGIGSPAALRVLCQRFTVRVDPGITDDEEKQHVRELLIQAGPRAVEPVKEFLQREESGIAHGLRVLSELVSADEVFAEVLRTLQKLGSQYTRDPDKKLTLLTWVAEHHAADSSAPPSASTSSVEAALLPLLEDFSDDVRIAATRALARQPVGDRARAALVELLLRDKDNARVRGEVLQALAGLGADVKGHRPSVEPLLVEPFFLDREGRVKKRG
jgi:HEAT repeat protein